MPTPHDDAALAQAVAGSDSWAALMRRLGVKASGGRRRVLQERVRALGLDTGHFTHVSAQRKYSDAAIAEAVTASTTLREVVNRLGGRPASGTLSHIRRRIRTAVPVRRSDARSTPSVSTSRTSGSCAWRCPRPGSAPRCSSR